MRSAIFILIAILVTSTAYTKEKYKVVSSHDELRELLETEDEYTSYRVNTFLSGDGLYLVKTDSKRIDFKTAIRLNPDLEKGSREIKRLYKLRGKKACFTVYQAKDEVMLQSFSEEFCK